MCIEIDACQALAEGLLNRGMIRWAANPTDRREKLLALTEHGQQLLRNLTSLHRNQVLAVGPDLRPGAGGNPSSFEDRE